MKDVTVSLDCQALEQENFFKPTREPTFSYFACKMFDHCVESVVNGIERERS